MARSLFRIASDPPPSEPDQICRCGLRKTWVIEPCDRDGCPGSWAWRCPAEPARHGEPDDNLRARSSRPEPRHEGEGDPGRGAPLVLAVWRPRLGSRRVLGSRQPSDHPVPLPHLWRRPAGPRVRLVFARGGLPRVGDSAARVEGSVPSMPLRAQHDDAGHRLDWS